MSTTKNQAKAIKSVVQRSDSENGAAAEVLTLPEAAAYLRLSERDVIRLVHDQALPGRRLGPEWRFLKAALRAWLANPSPLPKQCDDVMRWAGAFKDDPDLDEIVAEAYRQRGRPRLPEDE